MAAYYNEIEPFAVAWLKELIKAGHIADGDVDDRSIADVQPEDLRGYTQCHFFAGIGGWSYALRLAGWPDSRPVWTGSCPCQAHSQAARGRNVADDLWPEFRRLIDGCRPGQVFGEQVSRAGSWLDGVRADMEAIGYKFWPRVLPAYCVAADHERERIYFACYSDSNSKPSMQIYEETPRMQRVDSDAGDVVQTDGIPNRMAIMRGFGNAIHPDLAAEVIRAYMEYSK